MALRYDQICGRWSDEITIHATHFFLICATLFLGHARHASNHFFERQPSEEERRRSQTDIVSTIHSKLAQALGPLH